MILVFGEFEKSSKFESEISNQNKLRKNIVRLRDYQLSTTSERQATATTEQRKFNIKVKHWKSFAIYSQFRLLSQIHFYSNETRRLAPRELRRAPPTVVSRVAKLSSPSLLALARSVGLASGAVLARLRAHGSLEATDLAVIAVPALGALADVVATTLSTVETGHDAFRCGESFW